MYEADRINSMWDIPVNVSNLLAELKEFQEDFNLEVRVFKENCKIRLRELCYNSELNTIRCILIEISENPSSYSIHLFNNYSKNLNNKKFERIYDIKVEGENDYRSIKQDLKDVIEDKKGASHSSNYPI